MLKVAIIGAGGIGGHHAHWYHLSNTRLTAFAGTSEASCEKTAARLRESFGFSGKGYSNVHRMLEREQPDIVGICSPPDRHTEHTLAALEAGARVLCEKPLVLDFSKDPESWIAEGGQMVERARSLKRSFGMTPQLAAAAPFYWQLYRKFRDPSDPITEFFGEMKNRPRRGEKRFEQLWCDLSPHLIALLIQFCPEGEIDPSTISCRIGPQETLAEFEWAGPAGNIHARILLSQTVEDPPVRRFGVNGFLAEWTGYRDENGVYRAILKHGEAEIRSDDYLHRLIADFVAHVRGEGGKVWVDGEKALRNLKAQVQLLQHARRER